MPGVPLAFDVTTGQPRALPVGGALADAAGNQLGGSPPGAQRAYVQLAGPQSIPHAVVTVLSFGTVVYDTASFWSIGTPDRFTIPETGVYAGWVAAEFEANASGLRALTPRINSGAFVLNRKQRTVLEPGAACRMTMLIRPQLYTAGDILESRLFQTNSGAAALNALSAGMAIWRLA